MTKNTSRHTGRHLSALLLGLLAPVLEQQALAAQTGNLTGNELTESGPLQYVGSSTRLGIGYDSRAKLTGEISQVIHENATTAWIGDAWLAQSAGGLKLNYHFLPGDMPSAQGNLRVYKLFGALDQNDKHDQKLSLGAGYEVEDHFASAYLSKGLTGKRLVSSDTTSSQAQSNGTDQGRPYLETTTTTLYTQTFERAYDYGLGARIGRMLEPSLLRVTGGLDYEWGTTASARQGTVSLNLEKFFSGSPHSLALLLNASRKSGDAESDSTTYSARVMYRYEFGGKAYRASHLTRNVPVMPQETATAPRTQTRTVVQQPERTEKKIIKSTLSMSSDAFFQLGRAQISDTAKTELERIAKVLKESGYQGNIRITGHTCDLGPVALNLKLSQKRAAAVRDYLVQQGAAVSEAVLVEGKGKAQPKYPATPEERYKNRRVEIEFVTYQNKEEIVTIPAVTAEETVTLPAISPAVQWTQEEVAQEPAWMRRALHNSSEHKRTVDVYRFTETRQTVSSQREWVNRTPSASDDSFTAVAGADMDFPVLSNDRDPDGDTMTLVSVTKPEHGSVSIVGDKLHYSAPQNYSGKDSFSYKIRDEKGLESSAVVSVNVLKPNTLPVASNDWYYVPGFKESTLDVLANDNDPDGDTLSIVSVTQPTVGSVKISGNKLLFTPSGLFYMDKFTYRVSDGRGGESTATVTLIDP